MFKNTVIQKKQIRKASIALFRANRTRGDTYLDHCSHVSGKDPRCAFSPASEEDPFHVMMLEVEAKVKKEMR
jgi:hypothetical protein